MRHAIEGFRELYDLVADYEGARLFDDVLAPALPAAQAIMHDLQSVRQRERSGEPAFADELSHELFALDVVKDRLILPLALSLEQFQAFFTTLGFEPFVAAPGTPYDPLLHEIVGLANSVDRTSGTCIGRTYWPGLRLGQLVFARTGIDVVAHPSHGLVEGIADRSPLHFAYDRISRPTDSPAHGWGSNSRWRTRFHRFYEEPGVRIFNFDGAVDLAEPEPRGRGDGPPLAEVDIELQRDLLVHRCRISGGDDEDAYPYECTIAVRQGAGWPFHSHDLVTRDQLP